MPAPSSNTHQLQTLLDQATAGDDTAYDELLNIAAVRLQKLTAKMLTNYPHLRRWEETDDVFQTAAVRLHRSLAKVRPDSVRGFFGLAATQIRRTLIDLARHHFGPQGQAANHDSDVDYVTDRLADRNNVPESLDAWTSFHAAVELLDDSKREVFELTWYGGLDQQSISELLKISIPTVKRRLRSARISIHESLNGENPLSD